MKKIPRDDRTGSKTLRKIETMCVELKLTEA